MIYNLNGCKQIIFKKRLIYEGKIVISIFIQLITVSVNYEYRNTDAGPMFIG